MPLRCRVIKKVIVERIGPFQFSCEAFLRYVTASVCRMEKVLDDVF